MASEIRQTEEYLNSANQILQLGLYEFALRWFEQAIALDSESTDAWSGKAEALRKLGRYEEAIRADEKAIKIRMELINDPTVWFSQGNQPYRAGDFKEAIVNYKKVVRIKPDYYAAWKNLGNSFFNLGQYESAIASYDKAIEIVPESPEAWSSRGISLSNLGQYEEAIATYNQGLAHVLREANPQGWGILHHEKGNIYSDQARLNQNIQAIKIYYSQAITAYNSARQTLEAFPEHYLSLIHNLIEAHLGLNNFEVANQWRITGLEVFRQLLNAQTTLLQKRNLETKFSDFSRIAVDSLVAQSETTTALETAERYKNRCLTWILDEWKEQVTSPSYAKMRQLLNAQTAIVYWHFSDDSLTTFILTPDSEASILLNTLQYDRAQKLQSWIKTWNTQYNDYRTKKANQSDHPWRKTLATQLAKLREILDIDAIVQTLGTLDRLILIPHRDLHRLPVHSLFPNFTTVYLPSIQIGLNLQRKPRSTHPRKLLSVEDPKTDRPQMPYAQLESALTCHFFPNHTRLDDTKATTEKVTQALSDRHTHFHFTGHAGYDTPPENSALILANDDRLTAKTIRHLDLSHYELITLSACETALTGNQTIDTEFVGLVSAFLQAGATAVLSTLWNVDEISSTWLILKFYELQTPPAEALKTAQLWLQSRTYKTLLEWLDRTLTQLPPDHAYHQDIQDEITLIQENLTEHKIELHQTPYSDSYHWAAFTLAGGTL
ncbi:CHAT domain-containing protein [Cyanobacteria bacterium FACHB-DQ100]|nr:CHAT domain-containing protein [Cyanobacteria bacterium FACHB-DQ100]